jgi:sialic acid synthase SpsE|tara:strand:+ start:5 stop:1009 length:1005 start_codon:yes stop_codon:yes gene_type:complete
MNIEISNRRIGSTYPTYFIAEAGLNHNGDINLAKKMVDEAKNANSDAIKFQTYKSENFLAETSQYFDFFKNVELSFEEFKEVKQHADNVDISFLSTPFDFESADYLKKIGVPGFKIASSDITNLPLIAHIAKMKLPMIISTGLATLDEIGESIEICNSLGNEQISILHCVADYPAIPEETNLTAMESIREKFHLPVGYSDNGESTLVDEVAVSLGADIIEKHFTLDKKMEGPDHSFSIQPNDLKLLINQIRLIEKIRGNGIKSPTNSEIKNKLAIRKSIFASQRITKGNLFSLDNLAIKRPGNGIEPKHWNKIINKKCNRDIEKDELITWDAVS